MKVNISKAAEMIGKTRATLYRHIEKKGITVEKDEDDNPVIDISELVRVYGSKVKTETLIEQDNTLLNTPSDKTVDKNNAEISTLKKQVEMLEISSQRERDILEQQIDHLKETLSKSQDGQSKLTLLLESKEKDNGAGEWERSLKALENRLSNQEKVAKETQDKEQKIIRQNRALKKALDEERNKSLFKKLFG